KSIQTRLVSEVLTVLETTVWEASEYSTRVTQLNKTLNSLEKELLSQYRSNRLISTNLSLKGVKKRFKNFNISFHKKYNPYLNDLNSNPKSYYYVGPYLYFVQFHIIDSIQRQIDYINNLPQSDVNYKSRLNLLNDLLSVWEKSFCDFKILV